MPSQSHDLSFLSPEDRNRTNGNNGVDNKAPTTGGKRNKKIHRTNNYNNNYRGKTTASGKESWKNTNNSNIAPINSSSSAWESPPQQRSLLDDDKINRMNGVE